MDAWNWRKEPDQGAVKSQQLWRIQNWLTWTYHFTVIAKCICYFALIKINLRWIVECEWKWESVEWYANYHTEYTGGRTWTIYTNLWQTQIVAIHTHSIYICRERESSIRQVSVHWMFILTFLHFLFTLLSALFFSFV